MERFRRTKTLGQGYGMEELKERIIKENIHTYRRNQIVRAPRIKVFKAKKIRRMRMTGLQRQYFKEMYRLGKIRNNRTHRYGNIGRMLRNFSYYRSSIYSLQSMMLLMWNKYLTCKKI